MVRGLNNSYSTELGKVLWKLTQNTVEFRSNKAILRSWGENAG